MKILISLLLLPLISSIPGEEFQGDAYPLSTCAVSGEALGSMGDPYVLVHEGRQIKFCCKGCLKPFKKEPAKYLPKVDAQIIEMQKPYYPTEMCLVMDEKMGADGSEDAPFDAVYNNRLVRLCCKMCNKDFRKDPAAILAKLDKLVVAIQKPSYPMQTSLVSGKELTPTAVDHVSGNRLVRLASKEEIKEFQSNPAKYLAILDKELAKSKPKEGSR